MSGFSKLLREQHDQARHQQEDCDQAAENSLGKNDSHVVAQTELHHRQGNQAGDCRQGRGGDLKDCLREGLDQRFLYPGILRDLVLIAVDENNRVVDRQNQLEDNRYGIRDGGDLSEPVVRPHVHQGCHSEYDSEDHDFKVASGGEEKNRDNDDGRNQQNADHFLRKLRGEVISYLGRDIGIVVLQSLPDPVHLLHDGRIVGLGVERDRQQRG